MDETITRRSFVALGALAAAAPAALSAEEAGEPKSIDAWGHVSLPRFMSAEEYLALMDANGVEAAVVGTAATCPNLTELSRTAVRYGNRFRVIGMPSGRTAAERADCVKAQMDCGFQGIRLTTALAVREPELLDIIGRAGGTPYIEGSEAYRVAADALARFLDRYPSCVVCGTHFAGPTDPAILTRDAGVARLFGHPRFLVIFSRQGYMDAGPLKVWTQAVAKVAGWDRLLYGSEFPVALWRDETVRSTQKWIDTAGLTPSAAERNQFFLGNARRLFFSAPRPARQIDARWNRMDQKTDSPVWLFQKLGVDLPEEAHRKILKAYLAKGGDARAGSYRDFVTRLVVDMAEKL
jgi:hypothetical protein